MSAPPYQEGTVYLFDSVTKDVESLFGGAGVYIGIITKPIDGVRYRVKFEKAGEAPYAGMAIRCVSVKVTA